MKKLIFSLALLLMSVSAALAQTWAFKEEGFTETDKQNLAADATNWTYDATNNRYGNVFTSLTVGALTANGVALESVDGLLFTITKADAVRLDSKKSSLTLNQKSTITIKDLKKDYIVKVECQSSGKDAARAIIATNVTPATAKDFAEAGNPGSAGIVTNTGTVTADGDITLSNTGGIYIYSIEVIDPNQETPDEPGAFHNVSASKLKNQMVLTIDGDNKY